MWRKKKKKCCPYFFKTWTANEKCACHLESSRSSWTPIPMQWDVCSCVALDASTCLACFQTQPLGITIHVFMTESAPKSICNRWSFHYLPRIRVIWKPCQTKPGLVELFNTVTYFQFLNNITCIFTHFFTHVFQKNTNNATKTILPNGL